MRLLSVHEQVLICRLEDAGFLIDGLGGDDDRLWPHDRWPRMRFDRPLEVGARGGHGPIRYSVSAYEPSRRVEFRFERPTSLDGVHAFELTGHGMDESVLRHFIDARPYGSMRILWPFLIRWFHDAVIEDAFFRARVAVGDRSTVAPTWSAWVRLTRRATEVAFGRRMASIKPSSPRDGEAPTTLAQRFGASAAGVWSIKHVVSPLQREVFRLSGGRISVTGRAPVVLLTTVGRRSGKARTVPVFHIRDGERIVICNVNPGFERPNPWTLNLRANPVARVQMGRDVAVYRGREADQAETERYWPRLVRIWPAYESFYRRSGDRSIFILEPDTVPGTGASEASMVAGQRAPPARQ